MKRNLLFLLGCLLSLHTFSEIKWYNPAEAGFPVIQNQAWVDEAREDIYDRMPTRNKELTSPMVWWLSHHCAGQHIMFTTSSKTIRVRYTVKEGHSMPHMPSTGVTGVDLYTLDHNGNELWSAGSFGMGDTITYLFGKHTETGLDFDYNPAFPYHTFRLYLPLYNDVSWMEIGVEEGSHFEFEPLRAEKPIVAYGTSICQGACASRPGMAWTNILSRRLDRPVINLGFSGSAYYEEGIIGLLSEIDAKAYILDGLPNALTITPEEALIDTIIKAVRQIRAVRPHTPIILTDHLGYPHGGTDPVEKGYETYANAAQKKAFDKLVAAGIPELYHLPYETIGMPQDGTVEGSHASDYGMMVYNKAYETLLRKVLNEPLGECKTTIPVQQSRDPYNWIRHHHDILLQAKEKEHYKRVIIGNSIIHQWGGIEGFELQRGQKSWNKYLKGTLNLGFGWDCIENVLWRVYHDELDSFTADNIYLMIGTNNIGLGDTDEAIVTGMEHLLNAIRSRRPEANLVLVGIFPRADLEARVKGLNLELAKLARTMGIEFRNPGVNLLKPDGTIDKSLFADGSLHPNEEGYAKVVKAFTNKK